MAISPGGLAWWLTLPPRLAFREEFLKLPDALIVRATAGTGMNQRILLTRITVNRISITRIVGHRCPGWVAVGVRDRQDIGIDAVADGSCLLYTSDAADE